MATFFRKRPMRYSIILFAVLGVVATIILVSQSIWIGVLFGLLVAIITGYAWATENRVYQETEKHIETMSYRLKKVGEEALLEMPIGIVLLNDQQIIEWANPYMTKQMPQESLIGMDVHELSDQIPQVLNSEEINDMTIEMGDSNYKVFYKPEEKLLYFFDVTEQVEIETLYYGDRTVIGILFIDNYDEITQGMDDQVRGQLNSLITSTVNHWGAEYGIFVKRIASDRFIAVLNESILLTLEKTKFSILDEIRDVTATFGHGVTLSAGVGTSSTSLVELGELAQSSLDLVLGRGGDQVAIKQADGKVKFYGGKTNPVEKRTRVRARVISHALRDLIQDSDQVLVMGHRLPDMDSIGAAVGVRKMAEMNKVDGFVVVDFQELDKSVLRLMHEIKQNESLYSRFITPEEALNRMTEKTLLVVVDTHKPSLVIDDRLLQRAEKVVVIDHHRRGEEFIDNTLLVYLEPYASSTAELVTELIEYQPKHDKLTMLEATSMLAGITVDTKSFTLRTGARTFDAASYLRTNGADTVLVQSLLKEDLDTYVERAKIIQSVEFYQEGIAIAHAPEDAIYNQILLAQTADILLTMNNVRASFVIGRRDESKVGISARSLGDVNVQLVMEALGGGGHLTNAATLLENVSVAEAIEQVKQSIDQATQGGTDQ